jgi:hypothetical protein
VLNRSSWGEKWCGIGAVGDRSGAESDGFGVAEARIWEIGADSVRFGGRVVRNRSSLGGSGAKSVGWLMEEGRNQRALGGRGKALGNRCETGAVGGKSGAESVRFGIEVVQNRMALGW